MIKRIVGMFCLVVMGLHAEDRANRGLGLWKWSAVALSAANAADVASSVGRYELNPVLGRGQFGTRAAGIKVGISAAALGIQYLILRHRPDAGRKAAYLNFGMAGLTGATAARNVLR